LQKAWKTHVLSSKNVTFLKLNIEIHRPYLLYIYIYIGHI
jgi:hypothetical protein